MALTTRQLCLGLWLISQGQARNLDLGVSNTEAATDSSRENEVTEGEGEGGMLVFQCVGTLNFSSTEVGFTLNHPQFIKASLWPTNTSVVR